MLISYEDTIPCWQGYSSTMSASLSFCAFSTFLEHQQCVTHWRKRIWMSPPQEDYKLEERDSLTTLIKIKDGMWSSILSLHHVLQCSGKHALPSCWAVTGDLNDESCLLWTLCYLKRGPESERPLSSREVGSQFSHMCPRIRRRAVGSLRKAKFIISWFCGPKLEHQRWTKARWVTS